MFSGEKTYPDLRMRIVKTNAPKLAVMVMDFHKGAGFSPRILCYFTCKNPGMKSAIGLLVF
jgi:hypothetical protein